MIRVLIVGPFGQDARFICKRLSVNKQYKLFGISHKSLPSISKIDSAGLGNVTLLSGDLSESDTCFRILNDVKPDVIFHLAAIHGSSRNMQIVEANSKMEMYKCHVGITQNLISWIQKNQTSRLVYAGSSQVFLGLPEGSQVNEITPAFPTNEYGRTKLAAWELIKNSRKNDGLKLSFAILFNHTSEFSKPEFLFPEIANSLAKVLRRELDTIILRRPNAQVDICSADDISRGLVMISEQSLGQDYVLGSGKSTSVGSIVKNVLESFDLTRNVEIQTSESDEIYKCLVSNPEFALKSLGWKVIETPEVILRRMAYLQMGLS